MIFTGVCGAKGIGIGKAIVLGREEIVPENQSIVSEQVEEEVARFKAALEVTRHQVLGIRSRALSESGENEARIFDAHLMILEDPALVGGVVALIREHRFSAASATGHVIRQYEAMLAELEESYFRERAADLRDVGNRLVRNILGVTAAKILDSLYEDAIVVAHELNPSDIAMMDKARVRGLVTETGGETSHVAIIARAMGIAAVLGVDGITGRVHDGDQVIVDGFKGEVIVRPTQGQRNEYLRLHQISEALNGELRRVAGLPAETTDGYRIEIAANIAYPGEADTVLANGGEGVGLFRTEFLYLDKNALPSEDVQFEAYRKVALTLGTRPVIIRTLDVGGDKRLAALSLPGEENPFLGYRGIRLCLGHAGMFKTQLRAILRASAFGNILIMYPMITDISEVYQANRLLDEAKRELDREGIPFNDGIKVGIMVEVPSAAVTADLLAPAVDFFSIGTNDLCQYTMAVDRGNSAVSHLYQPFHPSLLRLIKHVADVSRAHGIFTGVCGEMASDPRAAVLLVGLGVHELSMNAASIPAVKNAIRNISYELAKKMAERALSLATAAEVRRLLEEVMGEGGTCIQGMR
ncbi:MAG: phosphoenolpyruvate--protein phosphotransferase [Bacillota bacterium]